MKYLNIYLGLELDDKVFPKGEKTEIGVAYFGPRTFLLFLETHLGLIGPANTIDYLRIAQYRQALQEYLEQHPNVFYKASFEADQLAATEALLDRRDELILAGWNFEITNDTSDRLKDIAGIEKIIKAAGYDFAIGVADRFVEVLRASEKKSLPIKELRLNEPRKLFPFHYQKLFQILEKQNIKIIQLPEYESEPHFDLAIFQQAIRGNRQKIAVQQDGSLLILRAKRETDAAAFLAKKIRRNPTYHPVCIIPEKNRALDNALIQEGLPSLGILSASLARPTLQIIKLVTTFLWRPIDPYKVLEFVTLPIKPLEADLAILIARQIAQRPGLNSDIWYASINQYFNDKEVESLKDSSIKVDKIRQEYQFWFDRTRYDISKALPKGEVIEIFEYVAEWAARKYEVDNQNKSLLVLKEQSKRIKELMEALPEAYNFLSNLELERIIRTIYQPSPVLFREEEVGHLPYVSHPSALIQPVSDVLWWNFSLKERPSFFSKWYRKEIAYLQEQGIYLESPERANEVLIWQRKRPILQATDRLILVIPDRVEGKEVLSHPLLGDLEATFEDLTPITFNIDQCLNADCLEGHFELPNWINLEQQFISKPIPILEVASANLFDEREYETFTSLDTLFYYPYQWVFRHKVRLHKSSILSVVNDNALMGNLAHRFIELLLKEEIKHWQKEQVEAWIDKNAPRLFAREGSILLMYGREPERLAFLNTIKYAAWSLLSSIQENNWKVKSTEMDLMGTFLGIPVKGKADLVLERGEELAVIDLKWRGSNWRKQVIKNEEDLQLVLYSKLLRPDATWAHTAYFILEKGEMIARNTEAFKNCYAVNPNCDHIEINERIWAKMEATLKWRLSQLKKGQIEIRTKQTQLDLEDLYEGQLIDLLEMKGDNAPFDDYETLIGLVK